MAERVYPEHLPARTLVGSQPLAPAVRLEWQEDGRLAVFTLTDASRQSVDAYIDASLALLRGWPQNEIFYLLTDVTNRNVSLSPYFRERLKEVAVAIKEEQVRCVSAVVMANTFMATILVLFGNLFTRQAEFSN